jgi:hypothetical protein
MSAAGEMVERSGKGFESVEIHITDKGTVSVYATVARLMRGSLEFTSLLTLDCYRDLTPAEARALAAAIVAAAKWAEEREGKHDAA